MFCALNKLINYTNVGVARLRNFNFSTGRKSPHTYIHTGPALLITQSNTQLLQYVMSKSIKRNSDYKAQSAVEIMKYWMLKLLNISVS
jgi:hypothetical protein